MERPRMIVSHSPGGGYDIYARLLARYLGFLLVEGEDRVLPRPIGRPPRARPRRPRPP